MGKPTAYNIIRLIRRTVAIAVLLLTTLYFVDFAGVLPSTFNSLTHIQIVPAIISGAWITLGVILVITLLFGRLYCSVLCPMGLLQDAVSRIKLWSYKIVGRRLPKLGYTRPHHIIWYGVLLICAVSLLKTAVVVGLLDPYSMFGRIATALFKPLYVEANNLLESALVSMNIYSLYSTSTHPTLSIILIAAISLLIVAALAWRRDRLWCNSVCPVGALLGLVSKYSIFGVKINSSCSGCTSCAKTCKSHCINPQKMSIDNARCVGCFNCLTTKCPQKSLSFGLRYAKIRTPEPTPTTVECTDCASNLPADPSRRRFLAGVGATMAMIPIASVAAKTGVKIKQPRRYPLPPGAVANFSARCTGCQLCVSKCPMKLLRPSYLEHGISGIMQPHMYFAIHKYCNYDCTICTEVCPNGAIERLSVEQKKLRQVGVVRFRKGHCIVSRDKMDCGACAEHCPTGAVTMVPYVGSITIPQIDPERCIGCGACESICPERPNAIFIDGIDPQRVAKPPIFSEKQEVTVDDFGF